MKRIIVTHFWELLMCFMAVSLCIAVFSQMLGEYLP